MGSHETTSQNCCNPACPVWHAASRAPLSPPPGKPARRDCEDERNRTTRRITIRPPLARCHPEPARRFRAFPAPCPWARHCLCGTRSRPSPPRSPSPRRCGKRTRALNVTAPRGCGSATDLPRVTLTSTFTCTNAEEGQGLQARLLFGRHEGNAAMALSSSAACLSPTRPWVLAASRPARVCSNSSRVTTICACSRSHQRRGMHHSAVCWQNADGSVVNPASGRRR